MKMKSRGTVAALVSAWVLAGCTSSSDATDADSPDSGQASDDDSSEPDAGSSDDDAPAFTYLDEDGVDDFFPVPVADGLAPLPPMGWNSWNKFACNIDAELVTEMADAMIDSGMAEVGYEYVNIDDCWHELGRDEDDRMIPDGTHFPDGIEPIADYVHSLGLKLGIYSDRGTKTCAGREGSQDHVEIDAETFAEWGVDYLKYDNCNADDDKLVQEQQYKEMGEALKATGRNIVYSLTAWNFYEWGIGVGHLWRTTTDIVDEWSYTTGDFGGGVVQLYEKNQNYAAYAGPNSWNDPDMLEVGNGGMTPAEYRSHFALWAIMSAPLIAGNDLRDMSEETISILTNTEVIAINQDALGYQAGPVLIDGEARVWAKPLNESGARAVVLSNAGEDEVEISFSLRDIGLRPGKTTARDLWAHEDLDDIEDSFSASVGAHDALVLKVVGKEPRVIAGTVDLSDLVPTYWVNGLGPMEFDSANGATKAGDGGPLLIDGVEYERGIGMAAPARIVYRLAGKCKSFSAKAGIDDDAGDRGSVVFHVRADGDEVYNSGAREGEDGTLDVEIDDLQGVERLELFVSGALDGSAWDRVGWGNPVLECEEK